MKKNKYRKGLAIFFALLSFGMIKEFYSICTSYAGDNRVSLLSLLGFISGLFVFLAVKFWRK